MGLVPVANEPLPELPTDDDVDLRVYPTPVSAGTDVTVEFASDLFGTATIEVFDLLGREVIGSTEVSLIAVRRTLFDTGRLSPGTYIVRSRVDDKVSVTAFTVVR
ncbi:MAG: T9SS type A sorting domain-containing protein [Bacteroidetes bacterium]|nr:T9SS type A sorting domain-containing protein [Bacteroidota bacterium]